MTTISSVRRRLGAVLVTAAAALALATPSQAEAATAAAADARVPAGLASCAAEGVTIVRGDKGVCFDALQRFLRYTINYRGYGPICENVNLPRPYPLRYSSRMNATTEQYVRCYQTYVKDRVEQGSEDYPTKLRIDGGVDPLDLSVMVNNTCASDSSYINNNGQGDFGGSWFCTS